MKRPVAEVSPLFCSRPLSLPTVRSHFHERLFQQCIFTNCLGCVLVGNNTSFQCVLYCTEHVLLNHRTPWDNTLPHIVLNDGSVTHVSSRGRFLPELSTPCRVDVLGNMVTVCGIQVSRSSVVNGRVTITVAALAPFTVGWWFNHGNDEFFVLFQNFPKIIILESTVRY